MDSTCGVLSVRLDGMYMWRNMHAGRRYHGKVWRHDEPVPHLPASESAALDLVVNDDMIQLVRGASRGCGRGHADLQ